MMLRSSVLVLAFGSLLAGCGARPSTSKSPPVNLQGGKRDVSTDQHDGDEILVWVSQGERGPLHTFYLAADGALRVLKEREGATIVTSHGELTFKAEEKEVKLNGCEHVDGAPRTPSVGTVMNAMLLQSNGQVAQKIIDFYDGGFGAEPDIDELGHYVVLTGSIGPYLFIREGAYSFSCGVHGNASASAMVWDANAGKPIDFLPELADAEKLVAQAKEKLDEIDKDEGGPDEANEPGFAQFIPVYSEHGALRIDVQFARWACYACSDGEWSSYTRSAIVPTNWFPERMKTWAMPPVVVKEFAKTHPEWRIGGWSKR